MQKEHLLIILVSSYVGALLVSNATAGRLVEIGGWVFPGAIFLFALTFTLRDAIQVVGGFRAAQAIIWGGLITNALLAGYGLLVNLLPHPVWFDAKPYEGVFGTTARVVVASLTAYAVATWLDAQVFHHLRQRLWARSFGSNLISTTVDTVLFITLAFAGTGAPLLNLIIGQILIKLLVSSVFIPFVYWVRATLVRQGLSAEGY